MVVEPVETTIFFIIMSDMYDKLGELLNEALESGKIPNNKNQGVVEPVETTSFFNEKVVSTSSTTANSDSKTTKRIKIPKKEKKATGEVIKMHKYAVNMYITPEIQKALTTLDIVYPYTLPQLKRQYYKLLKQCHPDSKITIQTSNTVLNNRQYTVDEIKQSYELLTEWIKNVNV